MAETILGVVTETVLTKAFSLASEQISRVWGVYEDLQTLARKVEMIQALLFDAARKDPDSSAVRLWLKNLQAVATDAENLLDRIAYEGLRKKIEKRMLNKVSHCFTSSNPLAFRCLMANGIKDINSALDKVYEESGQIGLRPIAIANNYSSEIRSGRVTHPFVDDSKIVGRGDDLEKILKMLTCSEDENILSVIGIVGMAGQGKTAIAQLIYKSEKLYNYFGKRIWLCVSEDFKVEKILNDMLQSLTGKKSELTLRETLVKKLKKELSNNRLLLILDDVWDEIKERWECMRDCLREICGANGCRILVTTRSEGVLSTMQASFTHLLGTLSDDDSWKLFEKIAFAKGGAVETPELVDIGTRIVRRCGGVPLAIKTLGGLMYSKKSEQEWLEIQENNIWSSSDAAERVLSAIKLSYDNLPLSLRQCFAFCSIYAKDTVLVKERLVELWMAQGLLNPPPKGSQLDMEHIGNNYFNALLQRSLLQEAQINDYGKIISCKMHDLVHDFAKQVSEGYCLNVEGGVVDNGIMAEHLLMRSSGMMKISKENLQKVRTLILEDCGFAHINLVQCKRLRVLVVHDWRTASLPSSIGQLKHLRHLDIVNTSIESLPDTITKLYHLQTMRVGDRFKKFPKDIGNMLNLRHIYIDEPIFRQYFSPSPRIGNLTSLQTINYFAVSQDRKSQIEELGNLQNLRGEVKICGLENVSNKGEAKKAKLSDKKNIACLELHWDICNTRDGCNDETVLEGLEPHSNLKVLIVVGFAGESLPSWMVSQRQPIAPRSLVKIILTNFPKCKYLPPLGHLPYLKFVDIGSLQSLKCIGSEFYGKFEKLENAAASSSQTAPTTTPIVAFPSLQNLQLYSLIECKQWLDPGLHQSSFSFKLFPHLKELSVPGFIELNCIPDILTNLDSLETLKISDCYNLVSIPSIVGMRSLRKLEISDCSKLAALPSGLEVCTSLQKLTLWLNSASWIQSLSSLSNLRELELFLRDEDTDSDYFPWPSTSSSTTASGTEHGILERPNFDSLEYLLLEGLPSSKIKSLPEQIQHLPVLRSFVLSGFPCMEALPEWLGNIHSLQLLHVSSCYKLAYLPSTEAMRRLTSLQIWYCPILRERCRKEGPEWHKIAHIPYMYMV